MIESVSGFFRPRRLALAPLSEHQAALQTCSTCPKLCRSTCPVTQAEATEVAVPTFKMQLAKASLEGHLELSPSVARVFYKCTGCASSRSECRHDVGVAEPLRAARALAVSAGVLLPEVEALRDRFANFGSIYSCDLSAKLYDEAPEAKNSKGETALYPSCTSLAREPGETAGNLRLLQKFDPGLEGLSARSPGCCGYPLYAAGLDADFTRQARSVSDGLRGLQRVILDSPSCAWTLRKVYPQLGLPLPKIELLLERLDARREALASSRRTRLAELLYHDSCFLGRRLGLYQEPRRVTAALTGVWPGELLRSGVHAPCAGAGGNYRWTHKAESQAIARAALAEIPKGRESWPIVSLCPSSRRQLREAEPERRVLSLSQLQDFLAEPAGRSSAASN